MVADGTRVPFAGRAHERSFLAAVVGRSRTNGFCCVLLLGDPGMGKTRLATELIEGHTAGPCLTARAYPLGGTIALGVWAEAVDHYLRGLPATEVQSLAAGYAPDLAYLLPAVAESSSFGPRKHPPRLRLLQGLGRVLGGLARVGPTVVFLDDAHDADASSWQALGYLGRHCRDDPITTVVAARPAELDANEHAQQVLAALAQDGGLHRVELAALDHATVVDLATAALAVDPPPGLAEWLMERSRGNPLFALGLIDALVEEGADLANPQLDRLPEELSERVLASVRRLDEPSRATLELLALMGDVDVDELGLLSARSPTDLAEVLERLVHARLVTEHERGARLAYGIAHPLVQEAVYGNIGPARRRALHRQVGRALLAMGRLGAAAPHFARSASVGEHEAVGVLIDAMREAEAREAYREAFLVQEALLDLIPSDDERWLDVLDAMAGPADWLSDHRADNDAKIGVEVLRRVAAILEQSAAPDPARLGAVQFRLAHFLGWGVRDSAGALDACRRAFDLFDAAGDVESKMLAANEFAFARGMEGTVGRWLAAIDEALALAEAAGGRRAIMLAVGQRGIALEWCGRLQEAELAYDRSIGIAASDRYAYRLNWSLVHKAITLAYQGRREEAVSALAEARRVYPAVWETIVPYGSWVYWLLGQYPDAVDAARELSSLVTGQVAFRSFPVVAFAAAAAVECGLSGEARSLLAQADAAAGGHPWFGLAPISGWFKALVLDADGNTEGAVGLLDDSSHALADHGIVTLASFAYCDLAEMAARAGDRSTARAASEMLASAAHQVDDEHYVGLALLAEGWARLAAEDESGAKVAATRAVDVLPEGWGGHRPRAPELLGHSLARTDPARAVDAFEAAASGYERAGARRRHARVLSAMTGLGARGRRATAALLGPDSLSRREIEVVRQTAEGLTAHEVAEHLYISRRTVESHLSSAYAKLGVASKRELVRKVRTLGL